MASDASNYDEVIEFNGKVFNHGMMYDEDGGRVSIVLKDKLVNAAGIKYYLFTGKDKTDITVSRDAFIDAHNNKYKSKYGTTVWGPFKTVLNDDSLRDYYHMCVSI